MIEREKSRKYTHRGKIYFEVHTYIPAKSATYEYASCEHNRDTDGAMGEKKDSLNNPTVYTRPVWEVAYWVRFRSCHHRACFIRS